MTLSVRLTAEQAAWLEEQARATGRSQSSLVKEALDKARKSAPSKAFMELAGSVDGPPGLSQRKGFTRP